MKLTLPKTVVQQLKLQPGQSVTLTVKGEKLLVAPSAERPLDYPWPVLTWPPLVSLVVALGYLIGLLLQPAKQVPLGGPYSLANATVTLGGAVGVVLFIGFFIGNRKWGQNDFTKRLYWRHFPVIVLAFAAIMLLGLLGTFWLLDSVFAGASFDRYTASALFWVFTTATGYLMVAFARSIDASLLIKVFTVVIVGGVALAMATNGSRQWWQHNLSFLGTEKAANAWQFNVTLIFAALILMALIDYLFVALQAHQPRTWRLNLLRFLLLGTAADLAAVGLFPNNPRSHDLHDEVASALVYFVLALVIGVRWLLPQVTKRFLTVSYSIGVVLFLLNVLFRIGLWSLTAFEIGAFTLAFGWIILLFARIEALIDQGTRQFEVILTEEGESDVGVH